MRDLFVFGIVFFVLFKAIKKPYIGVYLWTWISLMNPHRLGWGIARDFPFAAVVGGVTLVAIFFAKEPKRMVWSRETVLLLFFVIWMSFTTLFCFNPSEAYEYLDRVIKIQLFIFLTIYLITDKQKLNGFIWVAVLSMGFYGVKGGLFTILSGGSYRVYGPDNTFIGENNALALALIMTVPLLVYLYMQESRKWLRYALAGSIFLTTICIVGSQSRGAFLGILAMGTYLWLKSRHKLGVGILIAISVLTIFVLMPDSWWDRMDTIQNYQKDGSAMGRINAWWTAWNVATSHITGGGFRMFTPQTFLIYAPDPTNSHDVHSIYFQVLGEHGLIGFALFMAIAFFTWLRCSEIIKTCKKDPERKWAADLAAMLQVSLIGYAVSGAFLGLAYFDYYYDLIAITVITWSLVRQKTNKKIGSRVAAAIV